MLFRFLLSALVLFLWVPQPSTFAQNLPPYLPADGLLGWWPFNGNANDESGNGNLGVVNDGTFITDRDSLNFSALGFTSFGSELGISGVQPSLNNNALSISCWVQLPDPYSYSTLTLVQNGIPYVQGFNLAIDQNDGAYGINNYLLVFLAGPVSVTFITDYSELEQWSQIAAVFDGNYIYLFFNGILQATNPFNGSLNIPDDELTVASWDNPSLPSSAARNIDDIGIWNRALTAEEVMALYLAAPLSAGCTDPAACNFNPEANSNDGTCVEAGCTDPAACNYNPEAGCDDGSCASADAVQGCMEAAACNYDAAAVCTAPCVYPPAGSADCGAGAAFCGEGMVWDAAAQTCVIHPDYLTGVQASAAQSACGPWTVWDAATGQCVGTLSSDCPADVNGNGFVGVEDLLQLLSEFATDCP
jgi:hypothetical protein